MFWDTLRTGHELVAIIPIWCEQLGRGGICCEKGFLVSLYQRCLVACVLSSRDSVYGVEYFYERTFLFRALTRLDRLLFPVSVECM
jgi:hypothetical protein